MKTEDIETTNKETNAVMTVGGGCFWCTEAVFNEVEGVLKVVSGYSNGDSPGEPTYREVCSGQSGFAEVVQVTFNPSKISFEELLIMFMTTHDPTSLNKQGADRGTQYRSIILYQNEQQKMVAETVINQLKSYFDKPIVTEVSELETFYPATNDHQDFYDSNPNSGYCMVVIDPKLRKLRSMFSDKLKSAHS